MRSSRRVAPPPGRPGLPAPGSLSITGARPHGHEALGPPRGRPAQIQPELHGADTLAHPHMASSSPIGHAQQQIGTSLEEEAKFTMATVRTNCNSRTCECIGEETTARRQPVWTSCVSPRRSQAESEHPGVFVHLHGDLIL